jgi:WD40 repeat protein
VNDALFSPDGALVLTSGSDGTARVWSAASGQMLSMLRGHDGEILSGSFSSGGLAVTASEDGTARVWDPLSAGSILSDEEGFVARVAFTPDGDRIVTASDAGVRVWSRDGELLSTSGAEDAPYFDEALSPDGRLVAAGGASGTAYVWRVSTGHLVAELKGHEAQIVTGGIAFSPDGSRVVTGGFDETARLWDATSGEALQVFRGHVGVVFGVGFSPDGERIVTAGQDGTARVWDADTGEELLLLSVHMGQVTQAVFDPTGRLVATVGADDTGHLWNAETGELVTSFGGDGGAGMSGVSFSPDGRRLLTRSEDGTARVWDVRSGNEVLVLTGHEGVVWDASFDATGGRIVTVGADATVRVWDAGTGEPVAVFSDHQDEGTSAAIDPSGELVVSGDIVGSIWVNSCDVCGSVASLLDFADARATRDLDAEERSEYLHAPVRPVGPSPASVASPPPDAGRTLTDGLAEPDRYVVPLLRSAVALELDEGWMAFTFEDGSATGSTRVAQGIQLLRADDPAEGVTVLGVTRFVDGWKAWDEDHNLIAVGEDPIASFLDNPALRTFHVGKASVGGFVGDRVDTAFRVSPSIRTDPWPACGRSCAPIVPVFVDDDGRSVTDHDQIVASGAGSYDRWIVLDVGSEVVIVDIYAPTERFATFLRQVRTLLDSMSFDPPQP